MSYSADDYSAQMDNVNSGSVNDPWDAGNGIKYAAFDFTVPTGGTADTSVVGLVEIPARAKIVGGAISQDALGNTLDLGLVGADGNGKIDADGSTSDDTDMFLDGIDTSSASQDTFAELAQGDSNAGYETDKRVLLVAVAAGAWTAGKKLTGFVKYVV